MVSSATVVADVSNQVPNSWRITIVGYLLVTVSTQYCFLLHEHIRLHTTLFEGSNYTMIQGVSAENSRWIYDVTNPLHFFRTFFFEASNCPAGPLGGRTERLGSAWMMGKTIPIEQKLDTPTLGWVSHFHIPFAVIWGLKGWRLGRCELEDFLLGSFCGGQFFLFRTGALANCVYFFWRG